MVKLFNPQFKKGQGDVLEITSDVTLDNGTFLCLVDASSGAVTVTLFKAVGWGGKIFCIKKTDSSNNAVTIIPVSGETIDGASTKILLRQNDVLEIVSDGENYEIITEPQGNTFARAVKKVDESVQNSTMQDDDDLFVPLQANKAYGFLMVLYIESPISPDFKYQFPLDNFTGRMSSAGFQSDAPTPTQVIQSPTTILTDGQPQMLFFLGHVETTKIGTLQLQWAQQNTTAVDTIVRAGSYLLVWEETA